MADPIGLLVDLVVAVEPHLTAQQIRTAATAVAGGRAKSRRLAADLAARPGVLLDGRSPAARPVGELLIALRRAGATTVSLPCCAGCGRPVPAFQRRGRDWYCSACGQPVEACVQCGLAPQVSSRDRAGRPRRRQCPDRDRRDPITVIHDLIVKLDPDVKRQPSPPRCGGWRLVPHTNKKGGLCSCRGYDEAVRVGGCRVACVVRCRPQPVVAGAEPGGAAT